MSRRRRAVALSPQDRARVARGDRPEADAEVERRRGIDPLTDALAHEDEALGHRGDEESAGANDSRLLRDVPPHWG